MKMLKQVTQTMQAWHQILLLHHSESGIVEFLLWPHLPRNLHLPNCHDVVSDGRDGGYLVRTFKSILIWKDFPTIFMGEALQVQFPVHMYQVHSFHRCSPLKNANLLLVQLRFKIWTIRHVLISFSRLPSHNFPFWGTALFSTVNFTL